MAQEARRRGRADEPIASLETDKVSVEVPVAGRRRARRQLVKEGDTVAVGAVIARIDEGGGGAGARRRSRPPTPRPTRRAPAKIRRCAATSTPRRRPRSRCRSADDDHVTTLSPAVRRAVLEHHVDPSRIKGTGKDGRLTKDDVIAAAEAQKIGSPAKAGAQAPEAKARRPRKRGPPVLGPGLRRGTARKNASRCRGCARPSRASQGSAEHRRAADHVQRRRHVGGDRGARPLQGSVREEARHSPRLHGLLREGGGARGARRALGQRAASRATRSSITTISTSRSRCRRPRAWWSRSSATPTR